MNPRVMSRRLVVILLFVFPNVLFGLIPAEATVYVVRPDGSGDFPNIQAAINAAVAGDVIELANGTFTGNGNRDLRYLGKAITIRSQGGAGSCVILAAGTYTDEHRAFTFDMAEDAVAVLQGVTVTGGHHSGGGIYIEGASPTFRDCVITANNSGGWHGDGVAGGIYCGSGSPHFYDCLISNNSALAWDGLLPGGKGGGLFVQSGAPAFLDCSFVGNGATGAEGMGGHAYCSAGSTPSFERCNFEDGGAWSGAGLYSNSSGATLTDCTIRDNLTGYNGYGGGIYCTGSAITLSGCVVFNNGAHLGGGGVCAYNSSPTIATSTFYGNFSDGAGAHLLASGSSDPLVGFTIMASGGSSAAACEGGASITLICCDVWGNTGGNYVGCIAGYSGEMGNISHDPRFCDPANGDFTLWEDSPCAEGNNATCGQIGALPVGCPVSGIADGASTPVELHFGSVQPNPFGESTTLGYALPEPAHVRLAVYDPSGRLVIVLVDREEEAGPHHLRWDGRDGTGHQVAAGVYYGRLDAAGRKVTRTLVRVR